MIAPGILVLKPLQAAPEIKSMVLSYFLRSKYDPRSSEVNAIVIREMGDSKNTPRVLGFKLEGGERKSPLMGMIQRHPCSGPNHLELTHVALFTGNTPNVSNKARSSLQQRKRWASFV